jgi:two-component system sensor histidine kinase YesM
MTADKMLARNLISTLLPMLLSVLGLGVLTFIIIFRYMERELEISNANLLDSMKYKVELIMRDMDQYCYSFSSNPVIISRAKDILSSPDYSYEAQQGGLFIKNTIDMPVYTNPYLHSAYVYYYGYDRFWCSGLGVMNLDNFYDQEWADSLEEQKTGPMWFRRRSIMPNAFERRPVDVLTLSRTLYSPGAAEKDIIITLNLDARYIDEMVRALILYEGQILLAVDSLGAFVLGTANAEPLGPEEASRFMDGDAPRIRVSGERYRVYRIAPSPYNLRFFSLVPFRAGYQPIKDLVLITFWVMFVVAFAGSVIAVITTRRGRMQLNHIITLLSEYERTGSFPPPKSRSADISNIYDYIIYNLLGIFLRDYQMKIQLNERKYQRDLYELKALHAQMNPHFLYNVLETISWKTMEFSGGYSIVNEMIENLSRILKYCLSRAEEKVTLRDEMEYTTRYVAIQKIRYEREFSVLWEYDEGDRDLRVIKLLFQPIIENSMKHGGLSHTRDVKIRIRIERKKGHLCISVRDNGVGMDRQRLMEVRSSLAEKWRDDAHIGLVNTNQRLRLFYGEAYSFSVFSKKDRGTILFFRIPLDAEKRGAEK